MTNNMTDVVDALTRLERVGRENSKTTQKLIAAATALSAKIVEQYALARNDRDRVNVASNTQRTMATPDDVELYPWASYFIHDGKLCRDMPSAWEVVDSSREVAVKFAEDIAHGLLHHIADNLCERNEQNEQALAVLEAGTKELGGSDVDHSNPDVAFFEWAKLEAPASALSCRLGELSNQDLVYVLRFFHRIFHNLITTVANKTSKSLSYVQRVLQGERRNSEIDEAFASEFRNRMQQGMRSELMPPQVVVNS